MTEQEAINLSDELQTLANAIDDDSKNLFNATQAQEAFENDLEDFRAGAMKTVLQNKLVYTNEEWRRIGARDAENDDQTAQTIKSNISAQKQIVWDLKSAIEKNRKVYRAKELVLLFAANH